MEPRCPRVQGLPPSPHLEGLLWFPYTLPTTQHSPCPSQPRQGRTPLVMEGWVGHNTGNGAAGGSWMCASLSIPTVLWGSEARGEARNKPTSPIQTIPQTLSVKEQEADLKKKKKEKPTSRERTFVSKPGVTRAVSGENWEGRRCPLPLAMRPQESGGGAQGRRQGGGP